MFNGRLSTRSESTRGSKPREACCRWFYLRAGEWAVRARLRPPNVSAHTWWRMGRKFEVQVDRSDRWLGCLVPRSSIHPSRRVVGAKNVRALRLGQSSQWALSSSPSAWCLTNSNNQEGEVCWTNNDNNVRSVHGWQANFRCLQGLWLANGLIRGWRINCDSHFI